MMRDKTQTYFMAWLSPTPTNLKELYHEIRRKALRNEKGEMEWYKIHEGPPRQRTGRTENTYSWLSPNIDTNIFIAGDA
jgi:hypothetical protein